MRRGDIVVAAAPGDYGKPRPAVIVQSDVFNPTHASVVICPLTSRLIDAPLFRLRVQPSVANGLQVESEIMVDKITAVRKGRVENVIGHLDGGQVVELGRALQLWLDLARG